MPPAREAYLFHEVTLPLANDFRSSSCEIPAPLVLSACSRRMLFRGGLVHVHVSNLASSQRENITVTTMGEMMRCQIIP